MVHNHINSDGGESDDVDGDQSRSALSGDSLDYASPMQSEIEHDSEDIANTTTSDSGSTGDRVARLHRAVFQELKEKLHNKGPLLLPPKDYSDTLRKIGTLNAFKYEERRAKTKQVVGTLSANGLLIQRDQSRTNNELSSVNYNQQKNNNDFSNIMKRRSCAFENYQDPFRSDFVTNSNGRSRFSISDMPKNHLNYLDSSLPPSYNRFTDSDNSSSTNIPFRKFGDTIKPKNDSYTSPKLQQSNNRIRSDSVSNWMVKPTKFKSMENLLVSSAVDYDQGFGGHYQEDFNEKPNNGFQNVWLLPKLVDPFGRKYDQRVKVNNFTDCPVHNNRQPPTSWYIGPCSGYMI